MQQVQIAVLSDMFSLSLDRYLIPPSETQDITPPAVHMYALLYAEGREEEEEEEKKQK